MSSGAYLIGHLSYLEASASSSFAVILQQSSTWLRFAEKVKDQYALAAYAIAAIMGVLGVVNRQKLRGKPVLLVIIVLAVLASASLPAIATYSLKKLALTSPTAYRISVSVSNPDGSKAQDPSVSTDVPSHVYQIGDSIQVEITEAHIPEDRKITIFSRNATGTLRAENQIELRDDKSPRLAVTLEGKPSEIRGNVLDATGNGIEGATVSVLGYEESALTAKGGLFVIKTHAPSGETITLLVEKPGFKSVRQQHFAGPTAATITLGRATRPNRTTH